MSLHLSLVSAKIWEEAKQNKTIMKKFLLVLLTVPLSILAASGDYNDPATASGTNWSNPTNVFLDDANRATYTITSQDKLFVTNFTIGATSGFTIDSIIIRINGYGTASAPNNRKIEVALTKNGTSEVGDVVTATLPKNTEGDVILRGSTDGLWGTTWTISEINATTFGVIINRSNTSSDSLIIDHVQIKVWWTSSLSVSLSNSTFAFGTEPLNTWLVPESSIVTNDGNVSETIKGKISQFTTGSDNWAISATANGADSIRAQWSTTSSTGPWTDISAYDLNFTIVSGLAVDSSVTLWFQIETPISTTSFSQYSSTLTVTAE